MAEASALITFSMSGGIYVIRADGSGKRRLTRSGAKDIAPAGSPDGRRIAFESKRDGKFEVFVMNADGREQLRLTQNGEEGGEPVWSPDGRWIAF